VSQALVRQRHATQALLHEREETIKLVEILGAKDTLTVKLAAAGNTAASGIVRYNGRMGMLAYSAQLPEAPTGKTYQMWLVPPTGTPIKRRSDRKRINCRTCRRRTTTHWSEGARWS
jgi:hypothetical protein